MAATVLFLVMHAGDDAGEIASLILLVLQADEVRQQLAGIARRTRTSSPERRSRQRSVLVDADEPDVGVVLGRLERVTVQVETDGDDHVGALVDERLDVRRVLRGVLRDDVGRISGADAVRTKLRALVRVLVEVLVVDRSDVRHDARLSRRWAGSRQPPALAAAHSPGHSPGRSPARCDGRCCRRRSWRGRCRCRRHSGRGRCCRLGRGRRRRWRGSRRVTATGSNRTIVVAARANDLRNLHPVIPPLGREPTQCCNSPDPQPRMLFATQPARKEFCAARGLRDGSFQCVLSVAYSIGWFRTCP